MKLNEILNVINELNAKLKGVFPDFKGVYLYGSVARGDFSKDSDVDIVALFDEINYEKELGIYGITGDIEYKYDIFFDIQPMTEHDLRRNPFYYEEVTQKGMFYAV